MAKQSSLSDDELNDLLRRAKEGVDDAFTDLWIHEEPEIRRLARWKARGPVVNDELSLGLSNRVAEVVWRKLPVFQGVRIQEFRSWAKGILEKIVQNLGGRQRRYAELPIEIADDTQTVSRKFRDKEEQLRLLSMLTEDERLIVSYRFLENRTLDEIVEEYSNRGLPLTDVAVRQRLSRATRRLAEIIRRERSIGD